MRNVTRVTWLCIILFVDFKETIDSIDIIKQYNSTEEFGNRKNWPGLFG